MDSYPESFRRVPTPWNPTYSFLLTRNTKQSRCSPEQPPSSSIPSKRAGQSCLSGTGSKRSGEQCSIGKNERAQPDACSLETNADSRMKEPLPVSPDLETVGLKRRRAAKEKALLRIFEQQKRWGELNGGHRRRTQQVNHATCGSVVQGRRSDAEPIGREDGERGGRIASDMNVTEENPKTPLRVRAATKQRQQAIQTSKERRSKEEAYGKSLSQIDRLFESYTKMRKSSNSQAHQRTDLDNRYGAGEPGHDVAADELSDSIQLEYPPTECASGGDFDALAEKPDAAAELTASGTVHFPYSGHAPVAGNEPGGLSHFKRPPTRIPLPFAHKSRNPTRTATMSNHCASLTDGTTVTDRRHSHLVEFLRILPESAASKAAGPPLITETECRKRPRESDVDGHGVVKRARRRVDSDVDDKTPSLSIEQNYPPSSSVNPISDDTRVAMVPSFSPPDLLSESGSSGPLAPPADGAMARKPSHLVEILGILPENAASENSSPPSIRETECRKRPRESDVDGLGVDKHAHRRVSSSVDDEALSLSIEENRAPSGNVNPVANDARVATVLPSSPPNALPESALTPLRSKRTALKASIAVYDRAVEVAQASVTRSQAQLESAQAFVEFYKTALDKAQLDVAAWRTSYEAGQEGLAKSMKELGHVKAELEAVELVLDEVEKTRRSELQ